MKQILFFITLNLTFFNVDSCSIENYLLKLNFEEKNSSSLYFIKYPEYVEDTIVLCSQAIITQIANSLSNNDISNQLAIFNNELFWFETGNNIQFKVFFFIKNLKEIISLKNFGIIMLNEEFNYEIVKDLVNIKNIFEIVKKGDSKNVKKYIHYIPIKILLNAGRSLLHIAAENLDKKMIVTLLGYSTDIILFKNYENQTVVDRALIYDKGNTNLISLFVNLTYRK